MNTRKRLNRCGALSLAMITIMTSPRRTRNFEPGATALAPVVAAPVAATTPLETSSLIAFEMARAPEKTVEPSAVSAATRPTASRVAGVRRAAPARTSADTTAVAVMGAATVQGQGQGQG
ncbi:MAG: hypothetical protein ACREJ2_13005, partial [Planctomycetota bacterium]